MRKHHLAQALAAIIILLLLSVAALLYADDRGVPRDAAVALLPAFLVEIVLYILSGLRKVRERLEETEPVRIAAMLTVLAPLSYCLYSIPLRLFSPFHVVSLCCIAGVASFWYLIFRRRTVADIGFVLLLAGVYLARVFDAIYPDVTGRIPTHILGAVMWYRTGLVAVLLLRRMDGIGFGFVPHRREWAIGLRNFLWFLPIGLALGAATGFAELRQVRWGPGLVFVAIATFAGVLWVLAVAEEFFFRGVLQQMLSKASGSETAGLLMASAIFGASHLGYRAFPNWQFALIAGVAGIFYGRAYQQAGSIRAAMVTHACVVTLWKVFLT